jgi:DNA-binding beta-propeller fold protein YncE
MTALDSGSLAALFVTNVLNGTVAANGGVVNGGTVVRLTLSIPNGQSPQLVDSTVIASGFPERTDPAALVIGPTGVAFDNNTGTLFVADSLSNRIAAVPNALFRNDAAMNGGPSPTVQTVSQGHQLNDPLGLVLAPNGDLIAANGNDGNLVEVAPLTGMQAAKRVDNSGSPPKGAGALFGLFAVSDGVYFVDDAANTFSFFH